MTTTATPEADEIIERALKLSAAEREAIAWEIVRSIHPNLRPEMFGTPAEAVEYLTAKPEAVIDNS